MRILAIETSCDETAVAILECQGPSTSLRTGDEKQASFKVLGNALLSQVELHAKYGGVYPNLAKREHAKSLVPILTAALAEAEMLREDAQMPPHEIHDEIAAILSRESELIEPFLAFISESERPAIDAIAVTAGPGLEPALWVGINFVKALALAWGKPVVAVNHMEGHILAALASERSADKKVEPFLKRFNLFIESVELPVLALLISGGHTELVLMQEWLEYELIGQTRDDAVGEAFDKVARMLELPYPGGPEISKLAEGCRTSDVLHQDVGHRMSKFRLPRPMLHDDTCDFSFSGLKTAVRYLLQPPDHKNVRPSDFVVTPEIRREIAREFEDAVAEVLWEKTARALRETGAKTLAIGGGVSANMHIRRIFTEHIARDFPHVTLSIPTPALTTDNAIMIALAGYYHALQKDFADPATLKANGNLRLAQH